MDELDMSSYPWRSVEKLRKGPSMAPSVHDKGYSVVMNSPDRSFRGKCLLLNEFA